MRAIKKIKHIIEQNPQDQRPTQRSRDVRASIAVAFSGTQRARSQRHQRRGG